MPDSPTADEIGRKTRQDEILNLAERLFPEDGYETDKENACGSLFTLLCQATTLYAVLQSDDNVAPSDSDLWSTLSGLAENLWSDDMRFHVEAVKVDHADEVRRAIERGDLSAARFHLDRLDAQRENKAASVAGVRAVLRPAGNL